MNLFYDGLMYYYVITDNNTSSITTSIEERKEPMYQGTMPKIKKVNFYNDVATEVVWTDGTTTKVVVGEKDTFNPEFGLAMAIAKKFCGSYENFAKSLSKAKFRTTKTRK